MNRNELVDIIHQRKSYLCIGLDTDLTKIPEILKKDEDPVFSFNREIINATRDLCVSYKVNTAFYESMGYQGWITLEKTLKHIGDSHFTIADVKRSDIGNTARQYARAYFNNFNFDAVTLSPYMGKDSIMPFLEYENKWVILLGLTSNEGAEDFQLLPYKDGELYEYVIQKSSKWGNTGNTMYVAGSTRPDALKKIRKIIPDHFLLIPGIGAQGGDLDQISKLTLNNDAGILVNASRSILYAGTDQDFARSASEKAALYQKTMEKHLAVVSKI